MDAGRREFLKRGFREASLRTIVKQAGVTTGAFYGYYSSKEALFDALVGEQAETFLARFNSAQNEFAELPPEQQPGNMGEISGECMMWMVDYLYEHYDAFKLLLCCAQGTEYENFVHTLVEIETEATNRFLRVLGQLGHKTQPIDGQLEHILVSGFFSGFFEIVVHDMPREKAIGYTRALREFYTAGWRSIMGL
nr:TetR/AcrR family transcriptional regulator [Feifania hominis]